MKRHTLSTVFIIPFALQLIIAIGAVGYLSWYNGQAAVNDVATQLRSEISARVKQRVQTFMETPHLINQINAQALFHGDLDDIDEESAHYLWDQYQQFNSVAAIQYALPEGGQYMGIVNPGEDIPLRFQFRDETTNEHLHFYSVAPDGHRGEFQRVSESIYEPRKRPWYIEAIAVGKPRWGPVDPAVTVQALAIDASQPAYDEDGNLLGVLVVDIFLEQIDQFLEEIQVGKTGLVYIMERTGQLVADSASEPAFLIDDQSGEPIRIDGVASNNVLIQESAKALNYTFDSLDAISQSQQLEFEIDGATHFLQVTPLIDERGLDWLIVVVIPERDFTAQIDANNRNTLFIILLAMISAIIVGIFTVRWLTRPILELNNSAKALARGDWQEEVKVNRKDEIGELAQSFNRMAKQLQTSILLLEQRIEDQQKTEEALRESEEKYRTLVEAADDGIILFNMQNELLFYNPAYLRNLGYSAKEVENMPLFSIVHPDDMPALNEGLTTLMEEGSLTTEYRVRHKDGRWVYRLAKSALIRDNKGNPYAILAISHDITRRKELEKQIQQQDRLTAVGRLAAGVAHDFNNILSSVLLYTELLLRMPDMPPQSDKYLSTINNQSRRAADLIEQILDFSRRSSLDKQVVDLLTLIQEIVSMIKRTFPENIVIDLNYEGEQHYIVADPTRIHQVFMNLMLNARDAMPTGGKLTISLEKVEILPEPLVQNPNILPGVWERVILEDNGVGIPQDHLEYLFEPFFTTKSPGKGTGLGLAQVYGIVQQHEGVIDVVSHNEQGTTFTLFLPASDITEPYLPAQDLDSDIPMGQGELILVVEDNNVARDAIVNSLKTLNYEVVTVGNGKEALTVLTNSIEEISLMISDMIMPEMGGADLLKAMHIEELRLPTIILSGYFPEDELESLREFGMSDWLTKPPALDVLARMVARNIRQPEV